MSFRKIIFWLHLAAGIAAGVVIAIMSITGVALSYEKQLIAWSERDVRTVVPDPTVAERRSIDQLLTTIREQQPDAKPSAITVSGDPADAIVFGFGRTNSIYANPYTGELKSAGNSGMSGFMRTMVSWHRYLDADGDGRGTGKAITGVCNAAFLVLGVSGLYLWWPRKFTADVLRAAGLVNFKLRGKARDWNWHNAVGVWSAPFLIIITLTALPMSYRWAGNLIYAITGGEPPEPGAGPRRGFGLQETVAKPNPDAKPLGMDALIACARDAVPKWDQITLRMGGGPERAGRPRGGSAERTRSSPNTEGEINSNKSSESGDRPRAEGKHRDRGEHQQDERRRPGGEPGASAVSVLVKELDPWPLFSSVQLSLNPFTGEVVKRESYADQKTGRRVRSWARFLHTGEAFGGVGQGVAGLASAGALVLTWTGFALAWRRFIGKRQNGNASQRQSVATDR